MDPEKVPFFKHSSCSKHDGLIEMLDCKNERSKLEAMKKIIVMIGEGVDVSNLFPAVVKNVVSKNFEVKKLVYAYLERYAEEQQELALLSVSAFQRGLKDPNPLIRAGALRVLSNIRVHMIAPVVLLAVRGAATDISPYVRKIASHATQKLYTLDPQQKPALITIIQKLLTDTTCVVVGSAAMAFLEVCPKRTDLIDPIFQNLCTMLVNIDEWGQVVIVNILTRYARTQFLNPNLHAELGELEKADSSTTMHPDHHLLLRSTRPLFQSRNAAVVMAVAQLYYHCAPSSTGPIIAKALVRHLRSYADIQCMVLDNIVSISGQNKVIFQSYLERFFIRASDSSKAKLFKLNILSNLATASNVSDILWELESYLPSTDHQFVSATIQAMGRCASSVPEITDECFSRIVCLLSNENRAVVADSVIVIKNLLARTSDPKGVITYMTDLLDTITVVQARAAIVWLVGEHYERVPQIAPDVLRKVAKTFIKEHDMVKLQVLNLAFKLYFKNSSETELLRQYVFNLAKYDQNYDIRDRANFLKQVTLNEGKISIQKISFRCPIEPTPIVQLPVPDWKELQLGSLSHCIKRHAVGYEPLPSFPNYPPPRAVRDFETSAKDGQPKSTKSDNAELILSESEASSAQSSISKDDTSSSKHKEDSSSDLLDLTSEGDKQNYGISSRSTINVDDVIDVPLHPEVDFLQ